MGRWRRTRIILLAWAAAVVCLALYAVVAKRLRQDHIADRAVWALTACAEHGTLEGSTYLWDNSYHTPTHGFGWQGPMVDLIERGRHYPEMERVMLLLEARRVHDWIYLYPEYRNADLREGLMEHCLEHFPDDPLVHWAVGRLKLIGGEYDAAADEFAQALELGFDATQAHVPEEHFRGRYATALVLAGRIEEGLSESKAKHDENPADDAAAFEYYDLLCKLGRYDQVIRGLEEYKQTRPLSSELFQVLLRAYFWSGQLGQYVESGRAYAAQNSDRFALETQAMLALLDYDFESAMAYSGTRPEEQEWWAVWMVSWQYYRLLANAAIVTGDKQYVDELARWRDRIEDEIVQLQAQGEDNWEVREAISDKRGEMVGLSAERARIFAMTGDWASANLVLKGDWQEAGEAWTSVYADSYWRSDSTYASISALVAITRSEPLEEHSLANLAGTGAAVSILLSPYVASAAEAGGITPNEARQRLLVAIRPEHSNFWRWEDDRVLDW